MKIALILVIKDKIIFIRLNSFYNFQYIIETVKVRLCMGPINTANF